MSKLVKLVGMLLQTKVYVLANSKLSNLPALKPDQLRYHPKTLLLIACLVSKIYQI